MKRAARWMLPVELMIASFAVVLGVAGGVPWSDGATIYRMLHAEGQASTWLYLMTGNGVVLAVVSLIELWAGREWKRDAIIISAWIRWVNLVLIGFQSLFGLKAIMVSTLPRPPLFIGMVTVLLTFVIWAWWDLGKLLLVAERRPEALGRRYDPA